MAEGYQVIARRWRPRQFDEVAGQDHIIRTLKNAITKNRIAHAYLFVGPRGTGKTSTARIFAKALNCTGGPKVNPADDDEICQAIMAGHCMDVIEIDGASNNSVDQVRDLREDCQYAPAQCPYKIYIIDEVHMLSAAAFNALLKTLEEPPAHVKFIFATTEARKLLPTIVSRCQRFEFRPLSVEVIVDRLKQITGAEKIKAREEALRGIARLANGAMRDAQSILDQLISFCGGKITEADVLDVYGLASPERIAAIAQAVAAADYSKIATMADELAAEGRDLYRTLTDLQSHVREALREAVRQKGQTAMLGRVMRTEELMRLLDVLHEGETAVQKGLSEKINFEVLLLKGAEAARARAIDSLIRELAELAGQAPAGEKKNAAELKPAAPVPGGKSPPPEAADKALKKTAEPERLKINPDALAEKLPAAAREALKEQLNGKFRSVRVLDPGQLL